MIATSAPNPDARLLSINIRRLLAKFDLTESTFCESTGIDERTLRGIIMVRQRAQTQTIKKIADALGVSVDELYMPAGEHSAARFDRATNSFVEQVKNSHPNAFENWNDRMDDELYSQFGVGGAMTEFGVLTVAEKIKERHDLERKFRVICESHEGKMLKDIVRLSFERLSPSTEQR